MTEEEELAEIEEERKWKKACKEDTEDLPRPPSGKTDTGKMFVD